MSDIEHRTPYSLLHPNVIEELKTRQTPEPAIYAAMQAMANSGDVVSTLIDALEGPFGSPEKRSRWHAVLSSRVASCAIIGYNAALNDTASTEHVIGTGYPGQVAFISEQGEQ